MSLSSMYQEIVFLKPVSFLLHRLPSNRSLFKPAIDHAGKDQSLVKVAIMNLHLASAKARLAWWKHRRYLNWDVAEIVELGPSGNNVASPIADQLPFHFQFTLLQFLLLCVIPLRQLRWLWHRL